MSGSPTDRMLVAAFSGHTLPDDVRSELRRHPPAGVTLFRHHNVDTPAQVRALTDDLQRTREDLPPLLVAVDQEGGQFLALGDGSTPFAGNLALAATRDPVLAERVGSALAAEARACGADVVYAPVADVALQHDAPTLGIRSFGDDPALVSEMTAAVVRGIARAGAAATLKHFPGTGDLAVDPHHALGVVDGHRDRLDDVELPPFRAGIAAGADVVMSAHVAVPALTGRDDLPATLSRAVMTDLLRVELGFAGVTITDALDMHALAQGDGQVGSAVEALRAGVDLLLCGPDRADQARLRDGLARALQRGVLDARDLATSVERVAALARRLVPVPRPDPDVVGCRSHRDLAAELARAATTVVADAGVLPVRDAARILAVMPAPRDLTPADTSSTAPPALAASLRARFAAVDELVTAHPPTDADVGEARTRARTADVVVLGTIAATADPAQRGLLAELVATGTPVVHVALRGPHDLAGVDGVAASIATYGLLRPSLDALAAVLAGAPAPGRLPVSLAGGRVP